MLFQYVNRHAMYTLLSGIDRGAASHFNEMAIKSRFNRSEVLDNYSRMIEFWNNNCKCYGKPVTKDEFNQLMSEHKVLTPLTFEEMPELSYGQADHMLTIMANIEYCIRH